MVLGGWIDVVVMFCYFFFVKCFLILMGYFDLGFVFSFGECDFYGV